MRTDLRLGRSRLTVTIIPKLIVRPGIPGVFACAGGDDGAQVEKDGGGANSRTRDIRGTRRTSSPAAATRLSTSPRSPWPASCSPGSSTRCAMAKSATWPPRSWVSLSRVPGRLGAGRRRRWRGWPGAAGPVRLLVVAAARDGVPQGLELGEAGRLDGLGGQPVLRGLLEPPGLALSLGVAGPPVVLLDAPAAQLVREGRCGRPCRPAAGW